MYFEFACFCTDLPVPAVHGTPTEGFTNVFLNLSINCSLYINVFAQCTQNNNMYALKHTCANVKQIHIQKMFIKVFLMHIRIFVLLNNCSANPQMDVFKHLKFHHEHIWIWIFLLCKSTGK